MQDKTWENANLAFQANVLRSKRVHERLVMDAVLTPETFTTSFILKKPPNWVQSISLVVPSMAFLRSFTLTSLAPLQAITCSFQGNGCPVRGTHPLQLQMTPNHSAAGGTQFPEVFPNIFWTVYQCAYTDKKTKSFWKASLKKWRISEKLIPGAVNPSHSHLGWSLNYAYKYFFPSKTLKTNMVVLWQPPCHIAKSFHHFGSFQGRFTHETTRVHRAPTSVVFCECQQIHARPCKPPATKGYSHGLPKCQNVPPWEAKPLNLLLRPHNYARHLRKWDPTIRQPPNLQHLGSFATQPQFVL